MIHSIVKIDELREIYKLDNIVRYNTLNKLKRETVATHSFYATYFAMMICDKWLLGDEIKLKAMQLCIVHDIPEIEINDVTHDAKQRMPEIVEILDKYEQNFLRNKYPAVYNIMVSTSRNDIIAREVLNLADVVSVFQYCDNEAEMGNTFFTQLAVQSLNRVCIQSKKLEEVIANAT